MEYKQSNDELIRISVGRIDVEELGELVVDVLVQGDVNGDVDPVLAPSSAIGDDG